MSISLRIGACWAVVCASTVGCSWIIEPKEFHCPEGDQSCVCPPADAPVCGANQVTYPNKCEASRAGVQFAHDGPCEQQQCPPIACTLACSAGLKRDSSGCEICQCNEPPPTSQCRWDGDCATDEYCDRSTQYCPPPVNCPRGAVCDVACTAQCRPREVQCLPLACDVYCEFGNRFDEHGCQTCECNPPPPEPPQLCAVDADCGPEQRCDTTNLVCDSPRDCPPGAECLVACSGQCVPREPTCPQYACPFWETACEYGLRLDENGCQTCECNPPPPVCAGVACDLYCEYGFAKDSHGCDVCACAVPPGQQCETSEQCAYGYSCIAPECPPCLSGECGVCAPATCQWIPD